MAEARQEPVCQWETPLTMQCPKHGGPLSDCPLRSAPWPTMAFDRLRPEDRDA